MDVLGNRCHHRTHVTVDFWLIESDDVGSRHAQGNSWCWVMRPRARYCVTLGASLATLPLILAAAAVGASG